ncbi:MAG: YbhB/YbcL family Raf kinase inhibitor-like protein [Moraxella sp.]|nr:YbhB/YbcL family Raf kinase inhibitor-like protein [Moraxella sp.]
MKKSACMVFFATVLSGCVNTNTVNTNVLNVAQVNTPNVSMAFFSPEILHKGQLSNNQVANAFGCNGENISPELNWSNAPNGTKSFVITVYDPDAPTGSGFWHWIVYNIPANIDKLQRNVASDATKLPQGAIQSANDAGFAGFLGACPPIGDKAHRYVYTLYALNTMLDLPKNVTPAVLGFSLNGKVLAKSQFYGVYSR